MPLTSDARSPAALRFDSSAIAELFFLLKWIGQGGSGDAASAPASMSTALAIPSELTVRISEFWPDDLLYWELFVVAGEAGALCGPLEASELEPRLGPACDSMSLDPMLRSESEADQLEIRARLRRLRHDKALRREYLRLIAEVWALFEHDWTVHQLPAVARVVEDCTAQEHRGQQWQSLVKGSETASQILDAGWERAHEAGAGVVAICAYGGSLVIDLPGVQFFAMTKRARSATDRARAAALARRLRAVADPTRLALVELLASQPRSVGELAVELDVSQPTVSNHVKLLREAGLLRHLDASADRRKLAVDTEALAALFRETEALVAGI